MNWEERARGLLLYRTCTLLESQQPPSADNDFEAARVRLGLTGGRQARHF